MNKVQEFLKLYGDAAKKAAGHTGKYQLDVALWHLLSSIEKEITELLLSEPNAFTGFHKFFRIMPVSDDDHHKDAAIWELIDGSTMFWEVFHDVWPLEDM